MLCTLNESMADLGENRTDDKIVPHETVANFGDIESIFESTGNSTRFLDSRV